MDISAIQEDIDDLEQTILFICSATDATEDGSGPLYETVDELTNNPTDQSSESTYIDGNTQSSVCLTVADGDGELNTTKSVSKNTHGESKSHADIERDILAFTPIKCVKSSTLVTPVADRRSHKNMATLRKLQSTPNHKSHSNPLCQKRKNRSPEKFDFSLEDTENTFEASTSYSVIEISDDPFEKTFEELLQEVTLLCDEHTAKTGETGDMFNQDADSTADNQISKIDLEQLLSSPKVKIKDNIVTEGRIPLSISQTSDPNFFNDAKLKMNSCQDASPGRFKDVDKSEHIYDESVVDDLFDASEDILGLDTFSFSDDEKDDLDLTVIPIQQLETTLLQPEESDAARTNNTAVIPHVKSFDPIVIDKEIEKVELDTVPKPSSLVDDKQTNACSDLQGTLNQEKQSCEDASSIDVKIEIKLIQSSLVAERQNLLQETELMQFVKEKWKTSGIQRPDINLTKCTRLHKAQKGHLSPGLLEGEHRIPPLIRTINNYTQSNSDSTVLPDAKRHCIEGNAKSTVGQTTADLLKSLKGQLNEIQREWQRKQNFLHQQGIQQESNLRHRHLDVCHSLQVRQQLELQSTKQQFIFNPFLLQFRILQLHEEHTFQTGRLRDVHRKEMGEFLSAAFYKRSAEKESYLRLSDQLYGMINTFENKNIASVISKEGPYVAADLWKGPCRSNKQTKSLVKVCLPADIASYIMREDEIYDMFYVY